MRQFSSRGFIVLVMVAYAILCAIYFVQHYCWDNIFGAVIALPTLFATTLCFMRRRHGGWAIPLALLFSTLGDYAGAMDNFLAQLSLFAVAHIFFICDFLSKYRLSWWRSLALVATALVTGGYLGFIIAYISNPMMKNAVVIYGIVIWLMAASTIVQQRQYRGWYIVAALLFVFSDSVIAYGFVEQLPYATLLIMPTYYAAQAIFTVLYMLRKRQLN